MGASLRDRATRPADQAPSGLGDAASVPSAQRTHPFRFKLSVPRNITRISARRTVTVALGRTHFGRSWHIECVKNGASWSTVFSNETMQAIIKSVGRISGLEQAQRASWKTSEHSAWRHGAITVQWRVEPASAIEARSATDSEAGMAEGESAAPSGETPRG